MLLQRGVNLFAGDRAKTLGIFVEVLGTEAEFFGGDQRARHSGIRGEADLKVESKEGFLDWQPPTGRKCARRLFHQCDHLGRIDVADYSEA
jgi:hypothetical protein